MFYYMDLATGIFFLNFQMVYSKVAATGITLFNIKLTFTHATGTVSAGHIIAHAVSPAIGRLRIITVPTSQLKAIGTAGRP